MGVVFCEAGSGIHEHDGLSTKECGEIGGWVGLCQKTPPEPVSGGSGGMELAGPALLAAADRERKG